MTIMSRSFDRSTRRRPGVTNEEGEGVFVRSSELTDNITCKQKTAPVDLDLSHRRAHRFRFAILD